MTSVEGHFTATFPCEPEHTLPSGDLIHEYTAETNDGTVAFLITYTRQADLKISLDELLTATRSVMKSTHATVVPVTMCGLPAKEMSHEYVYDGQPISSRQRIFYANGAMYQLIVVAPKAQGIPEKDAQRFYSGFQLQSP
jgi:hypothetical protein